MFTTTFLFESPRISPPPIPEPPPSYRIEVPSSLASMVTLSFILTSTFPSLLPIAVEFLSALHPDGRMALNGDLGIFCAIANGRAVEPGCRDMDIFLLCGSPGRTNGHLCFGVLALSPAAPMAATVRLPSSLLASTVAWSRITIPFAEPSLIPSHTILPPPMAAPSLSGCRHLGMPPDDDVFCISSHIRRRQCLRHPRRLLRQQLHSPG